MKQNKPFGIVVMFFLSAGLMNCHSQTGSIANEQFQATSPCNASVKKMMGIPAATPCEMMRWHLTFSRDMQKNTPETFQLVCEYGMSKQNTKGFEQGSKKIELKGKWTTDKGIASNPAAVVYTLHADSPGISLSFLQPDQNLLHLLNEDKTLVNGNGAWSYTLNRIEPVPAKPMKFISKEVSVAPAPMNSDTVGIFDGRTPCEKNFPALKDAPAADCQIVKCRLILLRNKNSEPGNFVFYALYVGYGDDNRHITTGKWKLVNGTVDNTSASIYRLEPDANPSNQPILLLKADENVLFFIDSEYRMLVGNNYTSYTLNRKKRD